MGINLPAVKFFLQAHLVFVKEKIQHQGIQNF